MPAIDPVILQLKADVDEYNRDVRLSTDLVETSMRRQEVATTRAGEVMTREMQRAAFQSRNLGYQISDIGTQLAMGTNPFMILAQQAPQVANALEGTAGVAGRLAAFFSGPWGAALQHSTSDGSDLQRRNSRLGAPIAATQKSPQADSACTFRHALDGLRQGL